MFERFTKEARRLVIGATEEAENLSSPEVDPLHLLASLTHFPDGSAALLLSELGVALDDVAARAERARRRGGVSDAEVEALGELGIDVETLVERVEEGHGRGALARGLRLGTRHLPFATSTKRALERCLEEAQKLGDRHIGSEHILLSLATLPGPTADVLASLGVDQLALRRAVRTLRS